MNTVIDQFTFSGGQRIEIVEGDITQESVDAIVNAANAYLQHGGGVAGIIARRGGEQINRESAEWVAQHGPVSHAEPAYTGAGLLPCKYIIHAVGPIWGEGDEDQKLATAIMGSLKIAHELEVKSIAFPAISTGIFGFPRERAAKIFMRTFQEYYDTHPDSLIELVRLTLFDQPTLRTFLDAFLEWKNSKFKKI
jgi:O-acetyl-ADP-ribose deacetylase (regulator of RNase III)